MTEEAPSEPVVRPTLSRIGCVALNLLCPGLGLLRVGQARLGWALILTLPVWLLGSIGLFAFMASPSFPAVVVYVVVAFALILIVYGAALVLTWRYSAVRATSLRWWSRWYGLIGAIVLVNLLSQPLADVVHAFYKPFYLPSEAMAPTLGTFDKVVADMRAGRVPKRGDILLIEKSGVIYIKRVAALPGDRIAVMDDLTVINGKQAEVGPAGDVDILSGDGKWTRVPQFREQFPGEAAAHDIVLLSDRAYPDMAERLVPPGHIFVLGDNRERSADSRLSVDEGGMGMVSMQQVIGQPLYVTWSRSEGRIGRDASR